MMLKYAETTQTLDRRPSSPTPPSDVWKIREAYRSHDWPEVTAFLQTYPQASALLFKARPQISRCFGEGVSARLEVARDPESQNRPALFVRVETEENWLAATEKLDRLDDEWWSEASAAADCPMQIDIQVR